jgi:serine/threonine protein kinase
VDPQGQVGPYRLIEQLGRGGMGEVWLADDPTGAAGSTPRRVALKLIDPAMVDDPDWLARFAREVDAARRVDSPYVARLLDADLTAVRPWLASTYSRGRRSRSTSPATDRWRRARCAPSAPRWPRRWWRSTTPGWSTAT